MLDSVGSTVSGVLSHVRSGALAAAGWTTGIGMEAVNAWGTTFGRPTGINAPVDAHERGDVLMPTTRSQRNGADTMRWLLQHVGLEPRAASHPDAVSGHALLAATKVTSDGSAVEVSIDAHAPTADWAQTDSASGAIGIWVDGRRVAVEHVVGERSTPVDVDLGALSAGSHDVEVRSMDDLAARDRPPVVVGGITQRTVTPDEALAARWAPTFEQRDLGHPGGRDSSHTDLPFALAAQVTHDARGTTISYRMYVTDEDSGTPADERLRLWGRVADVERAYEVRLDNHGMKVDESYEGTGHQYADFQGSHTADGRAELRIATGNNNFSDRPFGTGDVWSPAPALAKGDELDTMVARPWSFVLQMRELAREHPVSMPDGRPTPDLRNLAYLHAGDDLRRQVDAGDPPTLVLRSGATVALAAKPASQATGRTAITALPPGIRGSDVVGIRGAHGSMVVLDEDGLPRVLQATQA